MGTGIAQCLAAAGIEVTLLETSEQATVRSEKSVDDVLGRAVAKGRLTAKQAEEQKALIRWTTDYGDLRNVDIAIEAVFESLEAKRAVFEELDRNRSEEQTSELQSLMRISYAVFCLKNKTRIETATP